MGEEKNDLLEREKDLKKNDCLLSREGWIMLLSDEIQNCKVLFMMVGVLIVSSLLAIIGIVVMVLGSALFPLFVILALYLGLCFFISHCRFQKILRPLINTREDIISGKLTDLSKINRIWKDYIKKEYGNLLGKSEMDKEEKESKGEKDCSLSPTDWVMFLSDEIHHQERTNNRDSFTPTITLLLVTLFAFMNWMFAARITNLPVHNINSILSVLRFSVYILSAIFLVYFIFVCCRLLFYRPKTQKRVEALEKLRGKIISGKTNSQKIREEWEEIYRTLYPRKSRILIT